jgi:predicted acetylornithine/succinylornithine family transaminase
MIFKKDIAMDSHKQYIQYFLDTYSQVDFVPIQGRGSRLYGSCGKEVIDLAGGIAVSALGHAHPQLIEALTTQAQQLWHVSNIMVNQPALRLGELLINNSCFDKAFLCNSGTEAVEAALKLARRYALKNFSAQKNKIVAFKNSFHGRSLFAVSVGGQAKYSQDFAPLPPSIVHGEFNDLASAEALIDDHTALVVIEPIQAEGGIIQASLEFVQKLRELCNKHHALFMFDEVQTGIGRTGKLFAYQHYSIEPDIISLAKALGGGFPIGAMLVKDKFSCGFEPGSHGSTFGGNPLACAVAACAFELINTPEILNGVKLRSQLIMDGLQEINAKLNRYREIRGLGLLIGGELNPKWHGKSQEIMVNGFKHGVATLIATSKVTRLTPALNIPLVDIQEGLERFYKALQ